MSTNYIALYTLYREWKDADDAWQAELERVYGNNAGDARYDQRGCSTKTLMELKLAFLEAGRKYHQEKSHD